VSFSPCMNNAGVVTDRNASSFLNTSFINNYAKEPPKNKLLTTFLIELKPLMMIKIAGLNFLARWIAGPEPMDLPISIISD
jgi:hypothetical protein